LTVEKMKRNQIKSLKEVLLVNRVKEKLQSTCKSCVLKVKEKKHLRIRIKNRIICSKKKER
jgi:hypothetical protein